MGSNFGFKRASLPLLGLPLVGSNGHPCERDFVKLQRRLQTSGHPYLRQRRRQWVPPASAAGRHLVNGRIVWGAVVVGSFNNRERSNARIISTTGRHASRPSRPQLGHSRSNLPCRGRRGSRGIVGFGAILNLSGFRRVFPSLPFYGLDEAGLSWVKGYERGFCGSQKVSMSGIFRTAAGREQLVDFGVKRACSKERKRCRLSEWAHLERQLRGRAMAACVAVSSTFPLHQSVVNLEAFSLKWSSLQGPGRGRFTDHQTGVSSTELSPNQVSDRGGLRKRSTSHFFGLDEAMQTWVSCGF